MNVWVVTTPKGKRTYVPSETVARKVRQELWEKGESTLKKDIDIGPIEISTKKPELLTFLNNREKELFG